MIELPTVVIRGAGDLATGVALRLYRAGFKRILMLEQEKPLAVRRTVSFSEIVYAKGHRVEEVGAILATSQADVLSAWKGGDIPVLVDPELSCLAEMDVDILVDAILAKKNLGTRRDHAPLVIGLGPGFSAGDDVDRVVETKRGHFLGRLITDGPATANSGKPGAVMGYTTERVIWAEQAGFYTSPLQIGALVEAGDVIGSVDGVPFCTEISGVLRGLLPTDIQVGKRCKLADIDPRGLVNYCDSVSEKALAIGGGVLEAVCSYTLNRMLS
ncbi:selenium-dependent molybdenum cofactor biosynthesis protein YqeB [Desulfotalea psychrophila]|uniref:selenium-dependent molybdenum cofactor biosynthesis protein YqeB n=1 Tax=Desulfotalea psychrophila TaxID=84980 RepID=UPI0002F8146F|nr:selenium-dependent molybdenum cofactor biosynthesis protein YqeB [Desulfotalea psychrophila]